MYLFTVLHSNIEVLEKNITTSISFYIQTPVVMIIITIFGFHFAQCVSSKTNYLQVSYLKQENSGFVWLSER